MFLTREERNWIEENREALMELPEAERALMFVSFRSVSHHGHKPLTDLLFKNGGVKAWYHFPESKKISKSERNAQQVAGIGLSGEPRLPYRTIEKMTKSIFSATLATRIFLHAKGR